MARSRVVGQGMTIVSVLERTGRRLLAATILWNLVEVFITISLGVVAGSLALVAFGLDSLIEVFASLVVLWHMNDPDASYRDRRAQRLVGAAFALFALYLAIAALRALVTQAEPEASPLGIAYLTITALVMFSLASWKRHIGTHLGSAPFLAEARMTRLDGWLATAILTALIFNAGLGWWWADPGAAMIVALAAGREATELWVRS